MILDCSNLGHYLLALVNRGERIFDSHLCAQLLPGGEAAHTAADNPVVLAIHASVPVLLPFLGAWLPAAL